MQSLRGRLLVTVAIALSPVLLFAGIRAMLDSQKAMEQRREQLIFVSETSIDKIEQSLNSADLILDLYEDLIREGGCGDFTENIRENLPYVTNVARFDVEGTAICSLARDPGYKLFKEGWNTRLREGEEAFRTDAFYYPPAEKWLFATLRRTEDSDGNYSGSVGIGIDIGALVNMIEEDQDEQGIEIAIVDRDGTVFGGSRITDVSTEDIEEVSASSDSVLDVVKDGEGQQLDRVIRHVGGGNIFAMITRPSPGLFSEFSLRPAATIGVPVLTFLIVLVAVWISIERSVLKWFWPLRRMTAAYAVGKYDYTHEESFNAAPQEIARLASTLENMARRIGSRDEQLREAIAIRDASVKEIHHRIKNNLQIVSSFVRLQMRPLKQPYARSVLANVRNRIDALSIVHQTLYQHERLETVELGSFFHALLDHLKGALGIEEIGGRLTWEVADVEVPSDDAIPMALFILEAVTNSVKYALETGRGKEINITLRDKDDSLILTIQDDGKGAVEMDQEDNDGLGAKLMSAFTRQLGAELVQETTDEGYCVELRIPKK